MTSTPGGDVFATQYSIGSKLTPSRMPVVIMTSATMKYGMRLFNGIDAILCHTTAGGPAQPLTNMRQRRDDQTQRTSNKAATATKYNNCRNDTGSVGTHPYELTLLEAEAIETK